MNRKQKPESCRAKQDDKGDKSGVDWDAEWQRAKASELVSQAELPRGWNSLIAGLCWLPERD
jgi:hypothetical protein